MWPAVRSAIILLLGLYACFGQEVEDYEGNDQPTTVSTRKNEHDVSILKQIHRHDGDGSYAYGYEASDGSFKIETKTRTGEVTGKYGYVDDVGKLRVVEYGANVHGFRPSGDGVTVPPPALVEDGSNEKRTVNNNPLPKKPSDGRLPGSVTEFRPKSSVPENGRMTTPPSGTRNRPVQGFANERRSEVGRPTAAVNRNRGASPPYRTYERLHDLATESPLTKRRSGAGSTRTSVHRTNPRQMRPGSILEDFVEQYALPESGSPVAHSVSFGMDS